MDSSHQEIPVWLAALFAAFAVESLVLGIAPVDRGTWALEHLLVWVGVPLLVLSWFRFPLSLASYTLVLAFLAIHEVGAHYTYSEVPYDAWFRSITGASLNELLSWERNHFDRFVHFLYGLLLVHPIRELVARVLRAGRLWTDAVSVLLVLSASALYELIEWGAAIVFNPEIGIAYVGAQGDVWDAQRDMALAVAGAVLGLAVARAVPLSRAAPGRPPAPAHAPSGDPHSGRRRR